MRLWLLLGAGLLLPLPAAGDPLPAGQPAELRALVIDREGGAPRLSTRAIEMVVGPQVELPSMHAVRASWGDDPTQIVEISVDLRPDSILISFDGGVSTHYAEAYFAGYEFRFPDLPQAVIASAALDHEARLFGMEDGRLSVIEGGLRLNVESLFVGPDDRILIRFGALAIPSA